MTRRFANRSAALVLTIALAPTMAMAAPIAGAVENPVVPVPADAKALLALLGPETVGKPLPAAPINDPAGLRHLEPGQWKYKVVAGANRGQDETVTVEQIGGTADDPAGGAGDDAAWRVIGGEGDVQRLKVTSEHEILKLSQTDPGSNRLIVYRPGLTLEPGMRAGETKKISTDIATYKQTKPDVIEYNGKLQYSTTYIGAYRVSTPAGEFDARLLQHRYTMKLGPAKATYHSYTFYADGIGSVAEVNEQSVNAVLVYRRQSKSALVLLAAPAR